MGVAMPRPRVPPPGAHSGADRGPQRCCATVRRRAPRHPLPRKLGKLESWDAALVLERLTAAGRSGDQASPRRDQWTRWGGGVTADEMREMQWVKPELVAQIRFVEWTAEGRLRHAAFLGLRSDKSARDVRREDAQC